MIFNDDKAIKLGSTVLPGLLKSMEIKTSARVEEQDVQGQSSKPKQAVGYEDAKINIELIIDDMPNKTKEKQLEILQNLFKKGGQNKPNVYTITNEHTAIRGINKVILKDIKSLENNKTNQLFVSLELWEYVPVVISVATTKAKSNNKTKPRASDKAAKEKVKLSDDYQRYLENRGNLSLYDARDESPEVKRYRDKMRNLKY